MTSDHETRVNFIEHIATMEPSPADEQQLSTVARLLDTMEDRFGWIQNGSAQPLACACEAYDACWAGIPASRRPHGRKANASVPWVGAAFDRDRIAVVGINANQYGGLGANWWITRGHLRDLAPGKKPAFPFRVAQYLSAIRASSAGTTPARVDEPRALASEFESCAFFQSIQCSPIGARGNATHEMATQCPPRHLVPQLEDLAPSLVVTIGKTNRERIWALVDAREEPATPGVWRGTGRLVDREIELIGLYHPSFGHRKRSLEPLIAELRARPLRRP